MIGYSSLMENHQIKKIVILGGGTAGWMCANLLHKKWKHLGITVTLVESPDIGIIGVGEGSTPSLKYFLDLIDVDEADWMPQCNATYKNGITFKDWSTAKNYEEYFHPFPCSLDFATFGFLKKNSKLRLQGVDVVANPNRFSLMAKLAENKLAPIPAENFPFHFQFGYHFDSVLIGQYLRQVAKQRGVEHIQATVKNVQVNPEGDIQSLELDGGVTVAGDFFVDCSGFASVLLQKTLKVPFVSFSENLFNDSAIAIPTAIEPHIPSQTLSTALSNGWAWKIPLTNRYGNGYVYSSNHISPDEAEKELRAHLGLLDSDIDARHLKMRVGRTEKTWHNNCIAVGLAQGFIEPLEATAIQFINITIEQFSIAFEEGGFGPEHREEFNRRMNANYEGIRDYIVLHYKSNSREDSQYWVENRENDKISDNLGAMLNCWYGNQDLEEALKRLGIGQYYSPRSWNCLLAGVGLFPSGDKMKPADAQTAESEKADLAYVDNFLHGCSLNFKPHEEELGITSG